MSITIRKIDSISEMKHLERVQKEVWGWDDLDTMPLMNFIIMKEMGAALIGAYDGETLIGFVFGFVGFDHGTIVFHSHMLAVLPAYRQHGIGQKLKLAQREQALADGFSCITWTFDPLQSPNAHLNFFKLGVVASKYNVNFYGEGTSSPLHRHIGTDRLWVSWFLKSKRVTDRAKLRFNEPCAEHLSGVKSIVQSGPDGWPSSQSITNLAHAQVLIDIPADISLLQENNPPLAIAWRNATRSAFTEALTAGYIVEEFYRRKRHGQLIGTYLLSSGGSNGIDVTAN